MNRCPGGITYLDDGSARIYPIGVAKFIEGQKALEENKKLKRQLKWLKTICIWYKKLKDENRVLKKTLNGEVKYFAEGFKNERSN